MSKDAAGLFGLLDEVQQRHDVRGDLFEIGVHHGKSAVLLGRMLRQGERLGACDLFAATNPSGSGSGNRAVFEANMARNAPDATYEIFAKFSSELTPVEIGGPFRLFHIDGGHLAEEAAGDLRLAAAALAPGGLIAVDDPFRPEWPGVTEAIIDFCRGSDYEPIALGFNKLVMAPADGRDIYDQALSDLEWKYFDHVLYRRKLLPIAGVEAKIYFTPSRRQPPEAVVRSFAAARYFRSEVRKRLRRRS